MLVLWAWGRHDLSKLSLLNLTGSAGAHVLKVSHLVLPSPWLNRCQYTLLQPSGWSE